MLLSIAYAPPIQFFSKFVLQEEITIEAYEHYTKQTYRNRCRIAGGDGVIDLSIPVEAGASSDCLIRDVRLSDHGRWRHRHWEAIRSSYGSSAFFEYYADELAPFYFRDYKFLWDFDLDLIGALARLLGMEPRINLTESYIAENELSDRQNDFRSAIRPKAPPPDETFVSTPYYQTFADRHGFLPNLSALDLLFEMGPESILILRGSVR